MVTPSQPAAHFDDAHNRYDETHNQLKASVTNLIDRFNDASAREEFQKGLDVQSRYDEYSHHNSLLIKFQIPEATQTGGYRACLEEFD